MERTDYDRGNTEPGAPEKGPPPPPLQAPWSTWRMYRRVGALIGLSFLQAASFGIMSPIISIVMTEYFARIKSGGVHIDCGANPHAEPCMDGSRQAAWVSSIFSAVGCVCMLIFSPMNGQLSDVYGRKPFLVLSQIVRVGVPFSVMYFMQPDGAILPYFVLRVVDAGFGTAGVKNASIADVVPPAHRATAFGCIFASLSVGYCVSAFLAPLFSRTHILQISAVMFVMRVFWALFVLEETLPTKKRANNTRWVVENPIHSMSILIRSQFFMRLTCLIALTSFVSSGMFQIQMFYLNTVIGFDVKDFGNLMLFSGIMAILVQLLLLKPLISCVKERGVIVIALLGSIVGACGFAGSAFYPHKTLVYALSVPSSLGDLSFPAISSLKSINCSEKEQGRLQGAIYGARGFFDALGPMLFASLYASKTPKSELSQALPFVVAAVMYVCSIGVVLTLPPGKLFPNSNILAVPPPLMSPTDELSSSSMYFDTEDEEEDDYESGYSDGMMYGADPSVDENDFLAQPLLHGASASVHTHTDV